MHGTIAGMMEDVQRIIVAGGVDRVGAGRLVDMPESVLFAGATELREHYFGNKIEICFIVNAKSGNCNMNCRFCSQSAFNHTEIAKYPLKSAAELEEIVNAWEGLPVERCGIVTSGGALSDDDVEKLAQFIEARRKAGKTTPQVCGSLGRLGEHAIERLKRAGLTRLHHNLETNESFYPQVCTTQTWRERLDTVKRAMAAGLSVCCGGLFGLGETWNDRISFALELRREGIRNIPMNFLYPHPGTPMATRPVMPPEEALRIIALFRHIIPDATLRVCGGRLSVLKHRQYEMFAAGANAMMSGDYLTIPGAAIEKDIAKLRELRLEPR